MLNLYLIAIDFLLELDRMVEGLKKLGRWISKPFKAPYYLALAGIELWTNPPRTKGLQLRYAGMDHWPKLEPQANEGMPVHGREEMNIVRIQYWGERYRQWEDARIAISTEKCRVAFDLYTSGWLFDREHKGSGAIGVLLFTLPITLPLSPLLRIIARWRTREEKRDGMSRHARAILDGLAGQLPIEVEGMLTEAFHNTWQHEKEMSRSVTLEEAQELLRQCALALHEGVERYGREQRYTSAYWVNEEGDCVGQVVPGIENNYARHRDQAKFTIAVLGSRFVGDQARSLLTCYKTMRVE